MEGPSRRSGSGGPPEPNRGLGRSYAVTLAGSGGVMFFTLFTGVVSARLLAPEGRGVVGAIAAWVMIASYLGGLGLREGMSWIEARNERLAPQVLTASLVSTVILAIGTVLVAVLLVPLGFGAQSSTAVTYAQVAMLWIVPYMLYNSFGSVFGARQRFAAVTAMRVGQPLLYAVGLGLVWWAGRAAVPEVLVLQAASYVIPALLAFIVLVRSSGLGRFELPLLREGSAFGIRAFGSSLGHLANSRLDLLILPAILAAAEIGLYVVAISAASMIVGLFGSLSLVVFPAAARAGGQAAVALAQRAMRLVLVGSVVLALMLWLAAPWLVTGLYGGEFAGAVTPLRLLLPGVCFWATASIVGSSLKAIGRPSAASGCQFAGVLVTVIGLALLLRPYGIVGAAITSSLSYTTVFVVGLFLFSRATDTSMRSVFDLRSVVRDGHWILLRLRAILPQRQRSSSGHE